jgi:hypothetical protein
LIATFTMPANAVTVTAGFEEIVASAPDSDGNVDVPVTIAAVPDPDAIGIMLELGEADTTQKDALNGLPSNAAWTLAQGQVFTVAVAVVRLSGSSLPEISDLSYVDRIKVSVPYTAGPAPTGQKLVVKYPDETTGAAPEVDAYPVLEGGFLTFYTTHLSLFAVDTVTAGSGGGPGGGGSAATPTEPKEEEPKEEENGVGDGLFAPDANVSRQDFAVLLLRYADFAKKQFPTTRQFSIFADDAEIADYAKNAIQTLYNGGIINGVGDNAINPKDSATRAEVAAMLHRFVEAAQ